MTETGEDGLENNGSSGGLFIQDMPEGPRERLRGEIFTSLANRETEAADALKGLLTFCSLIYSGGTIALLSFIGARATTGAPVLAVAGFFCFVAALMSFALLYQRHSQLHAARREHFATVAQGFFLREYSFQQVMMAQSFGRSARLYQLIFWVPFILASMGFVFGALAALGVGPLIQVPK